MQTLLLLSFLAQSQQITLADYYKVETVSAPSISPDGKQLAYVKTTIVEAENRRHSQICLAAKCLAQIKASAANPRWSPDGKLLSYTSAAKTWFLNASQLDGEPFEIPGLEGAPVFSPDNRWIAFTRRTPPSAPKPQSSQTDFERQIDERFKGRAYDWMNFRFDGRGYLPDPRDSYATPPLELHLIPRQGGEAKRLTSLGVDVLTPAWSPDSQAIAFVANTHQRDEYTYERADLFTVNLEGRINRLTDDNHNYATPVWSPDSKSIAFLREQSLSLVLERKLSQGSPLDIYSMPAAGGILVNLTADWDDLPAKPRWHPAGKSLYFEAATRGTGHLFGLDLQSRQITQITQGDRLLSDFDLNLEQGLIAYVGTNPSTPVELFSAPLSNPSGETQITRQAARWTLGRTERIGFDSKDGTSIEGWVTLPPNYSADGPRYPVILNIHGGPHGAYASSFSFLHQLQAAAGYIVLYTNPRASTGYGEKFRWGTWGGWGGKDLEDVMAGVDSALKRYHADPTRLGITGYSYGGFLTNWAIGHTNRFRAAIVGAGPTNWISNYGTGDIPRTKESEFLGPPWSPTGNATMIRNSPITYAANIETPTLFIHGESDVRVPIAQAEELYTALKKRKIPARFIRYPNSFHGGWSPWNTVHRYQQEMNWWQHYLSLSAASR